MLHAHTLIMKELITARLPAMQNSCLLPIVHSKQRIFEYIHATVAATTAIKIRATAVPNLSNTKHKTCGFKKPCNLKRRMGYMATHAIQ